MDFLLENNKRASFIKDLRVPYMERSCSSVVRYGTPFENAQRWMGQNTFLILPLNDDNMIGEH